MKYAVVVPARNEEKYIKKTLCALREQTIPPNQLIVVDDGSKDETRKIATNYADVVVQLHDRGYSVVGRPELAEVVNEGLRRVKKDIDYVLICGADAVLPKCYVKIIVNKMEANPKLVIASGRIQGEPFFEQHPRGSGRIVNANFWRKVNGLLYPIVWGWETWLCYKAIQLGCEVRSFHDVVTEVQRPTRIEKAELWGKAMYALGYDWKYALGRCMLTSVKNPKAGWSMFLGWLLHKDVKRLDLADWVNKMQKKLFWKRVKTIIRHLGRR